VTMGRMCVGALLLCGLGGAAAPAYAQGPGDVRSFKEEGNRQMDALRPSEALAAYRQAYELSHQPALHYNMARALEALGEYPEALSEYEQFEHTAPPSVRALIPNLDEVMNELRSHVTTVTFKCGVPHARVVIRSVAVGGTDDDGSYVQSFASGPATIEVYASGYAPGSRTVVFERGEKQTVRFDLLPAKSTPVLSISTKEGPADVFVDGQSVGRTPVDESVSEGTHTVVVRGFGKEKTLTADVVNGQTRHIVVDLKSSTSIVTKWWFWTSVGVVVTGGVVLTSILLTQPSAGTGTISPGRAAVPATPLALRF
jgi:hypothetical protein